MATIKPIVVNIRVTVNDKPDVPLWRVRWARRIARLFRLPLDAYVETEK